VSADILAEHNSIKGGTLSTAPRAPSSASIIRRQKDKKQILKSVLLFYAIACGFAWLAWMPLVLGPAGLKLHQHPVRSRSRPVSERWDLFSRASSVIACRPVIGELSGCCLEVGCK
jgi:hypothetical protein